jgi:hypothetical protein
MKTGAVIRTGDVIKLGSTILLIKESSIDIKKIKENEKLTKLHKKDNFDEKILS